MKKNHKGFLSIALIYSFFIIFLGIIIFIIYSYRSDRKVVDEIKDEIKTEVKVNK